MFYDAAVTICLLLIFTTANVKYSSQLPNQGSKPLNDEIEDQTMPITMEKIKKLLKENRVFDENEPSLTSEDQKELVNLYEVMTVVLTSRNRQPAVVQNKFSTLQAVERIVKEQLAEKHISASLASKFKWNNIEQQKSKVDLPKKSSTNRKENHL